MLLITFCALFYLGQSAATTGGSIQSHLSHDWPTVPGGSIVKLCPGSHENDILAISRITNDPETPYLNEGVMVIIDGNFTKNVSAASTVDWDVIVRANPGDTGELNGTFHICDYMEEMRQPPGSDIERSCPPSKGPVMIDYMMWFANFLVAPGQWLVKFEAKTPEGEQIYCLLAEFDLQCLPDDEGPECLRDISAMEGFSIDDLLQRQPGNGRNVLHDGL